MVKKENIQVLTSGKETDLDRLEVDAAREVKAHVDVVACDKSGRRRWLIDYDRKGGLP